MCTALNQWVAMDAVALYEFLITVLESDLKILKMMPYAIAACSALDAQDWVGLGMLDT